MKQRLLLAVLIASATTAFGQGSQGPSTAKTWTLMECIEYAYKNNIQVKQSELNVMTDEINLRQSQFNRLPNLTASTSVTNSVGRSIDPFTNLIINQDINSQNYSANSNITLFNGFGQTSAIQRNRANLDKSRYDLEDAKNTTALNISSYYLNILLAQEQYKNTQLSLETSRLQVERTRKQVDAGALPTQNLLQIKQQYANDEVLMIQAENNLELARLTLKQALQLPASEDMEIVVPVIDEPSEEFLLLGMDDIYQNSQSLPVIKSAESQVLSFRHGVTVARSGRYPTLSLNGGFNTNYSSAAPDVFPDPSSPTGVKENTYFNQLDFNQRRFVSLQLNVPIFNRFSTNTNIGLAKIQWENAKYIERNVKNQLRQDVEQSFYNARAALKTYQATKDQVEALQESFRNATQRNELGAINPFEYNQIKNDYTRAQNELVRSKYDYIFKVKVLDFYQGKPLGF
jgi:outer membrane protein